MLAVPEKRYRFLPTAMKAALMSQVMISIDSPYYFYMHPCRLARSSGPHQFSNSWKVSNQDSAVAVSQQPRVTWGGVYVNHGPLHSRQGPHRHLTATKPGASSPVVPAHFCPHQPTCFSEGKNNSSNSSVRIFTLSSIADFPPFLLEILHFSSI